MLKEIMEQPQAVSGALRERVDFTEGRVVLPDFPISDTDICSLDKVVLIGCGTSLHAAQAGRHLVERLAGLPAEADSASEFRYRSPVINSRTLVVSIGQSGETADTIAAMQEAQERGARLITICNTEGSQASRLAEGTLYMRSGIEIGVASTKTFIASLTILTLLAAYLGQARGFLTSSEMRQLVDDLALCPRLLGEVLAGAEQYQDLARRLNVYNNFLFLGRGMNATIALEGALKLKEISYIHAEGYPAGEMKHGPIALIDRQMATLALAPQDQLYDKMVSNIREVKARDGVVIAVLTEGDEELAAWVDEAIFIPQVPEALMPLVITLPLQLLAYHIAVRRGCDVDQPRNLAKSVTVE
jgi:glucosamine--fructose-6-phosphate aminotransferase (isomerizing)